MKLTGSLFGVKKMIPYRHQTFNDIHNYKDSLVINSFSQQMINDLIFLDNDGNSGSSFVSNPYGSLNGKENIIISS